MNFIDKGNSLLGSGLNPVGSDLGDPAIDLYVDLGDLEPLYRKGSEGKIIASPCSSDRRREKKNWKSVIFFDDGEQQQLYFFSEAGHP
ncbi:hypothetical protein LWI29_018455 [Acer saccharum]|uniref:Uncharacterized protein n=1 Tax=Acer saccharum TaxID=4024 RepID=A0AA39VZE4_ACESA|nr:hypothetical protein LWI29_018455 [Acer saccharum]